MYIHILAHLQFTPSLSHFFLVKDFISSWLSPEIFREIHARLVTFKICFKIAMRHSLRTRSSCVIALLLKRTYVILQHKYIANENDGKKRFMITTGKKICIVLATLFFITEIYSDLWILVITILRQLIYK